MLANVLGIAEGGETSVRRSQIEALSFSRSIGIAPRRAKTNFYELNLKIKTNIIRFWRNSRTDVELFTLAPLLAIPCCRQFFIIR